MTLGCQLIVKASKHLFSFSLPLFSSGTQIVPCYTHAGKCEGCSQCLSPCIDDVPDRAVQEAGTFTVGIAPSTDITNANRISDASPVTRQSHNGGAIRARHLD